MDNKTKEMFNNYDGVTVIVKTTSGVENTFKIIGANAQRQYIKISEELKNNEILFIEIGDIIYQKNCLESVQMYS